MRKVSDERLECVPVCTLSELISCLGYKASHRHKRGNKTSTRFNRRHLAIAVHKGLYMVAPLVNTAAHRLRQGYSSLTRCSANTTIGDAAAGADSCILVLPTPSPSPTSLLHFPLPFISPLRSSLVDGNVLRDRRQEDTEL